MVLALHESESARRDCSKVFIAELAQETETQLTVRLCDECNLEISYEQI